jgi:diacylglycerol kinase
VGSSSEYLEPFGLSYFSSIKSTLQMSHQLSGLPRSGLVEFLKSRGRAFRYAFYGWWYVIRTQRNAWIHTLASIIIISLSFWVGLEPLEWALIVFSIALVWLSEFINTALEAVVDLASPQQHYLARVGKDVGAAAVLIAAGTSVIIGLLILGPPLWARLQALFS